jgi:hypothetical protein
MKSITLDDLHWFSFDDRFPAKKDLTIWQAVAFILSITDSTDLKDIQNYTQEMARIESESASDLFDSNGMDDEGGSFVLKFKPDRIDDDLSLLDRNREQVVDYFGGAFPVVYDLLLMEIDKLGSGVETSLAIKAKNISGNKYYLFGKGSLKKWKSIDLLNDLGILKIKLRRRVKSSTEENRGMITGMLVHLLSHQPLYEGDTPVDFSWGDQRIGYSKFYNYFKFNFIDDTRSSNFPNIKTVLDYLQKSHKLLINDVHLKTKP